MSRQIRIDYQAVNGKGVVLYTFSDLAQARSWARDNVHLHDGVRIERLTLSADTVYTPRPVHRRPDFSIPQWAAVPTAAGAA